MHVDLDPGLTLVRQPSPRASALHRLAIAHLHGRAMNGSEDANNRRTGAPECYWIDAGNTASTHLLYDLAPARRVLEGLAVARAFTAYQHHALVETVGERAGAETALLVVPNVAALYGDDDLAAHERTDLLATALATLRGIARSLAVPVVVSAAGADDGQGGRATGDAAATASGGDADLPSIVAAFADREIECTRTREGWRVEGPGVEQRGYWHRGYWQTTIPYWVDLLGVGALAPVWERDALAPFQGRAGPRAGDWMADGDDRPALSRAARGDAHWTSEASPMATGGSTAIASGPAGDRESEVNA